MKLRMYYLKIWGKPYHIILFTLIVLIVLLAGMVSTNTLSFINNNELPVIVVNGDLNSNQNETQLMIPTIKVDSNFINSSKTLMMLEYFDMVYMENQKIIVNFVNHNLWLNLLGNNQTSTEFIISNSEQNFSNSVKTINFGNNQLLELNFTDSNYYNNLNLHKIFYSKLGNSLAIDNYFRLILPIDMLDHFLLVQPKLYLRIYYFIYDDFFTSSISFDQSLTEIGSHKENIYLQFSTKVNNLEVNSSLQLGITRSQQRATERLLSILYIFIPVILLLEIIAVFIINEMLRSKKKQYNLLIKRGFSKQLIRKYLYLYYVILPVLSCSLTVLLFIFLKLNKIYLINSSTIIVPFIFFQILGSSYIIEKNLRNFSIQEKYTLSFSKIKKINYRKFIIFLIAYNIFLFLYYWNNFNLSGRYDRFNREIFEIINNFIIIIIIGLLYRLIAIIDDKRKKLNLENKKIIFSLNNLKLNFKLVSVLLLITFLGTLGAADNNILSQKVSYDNIDYTFDYELEFDSININTAGKLQDLEKLKSLGLKYYLPIYSKSIIIHTDSFSDHHYLLQFNYTQLKTIYENIGLHDIALEFENGFFIENPYYEQLKNENVFINNNKIRPADIHLLQKNYRLSLRHSTQSRVIASQSFFDSLRIDTTNANYKLSVLLFWNENLIDQSLLEQKISDILNISEYAFSTGSINDTEHPMENFLEEDYIYIYFIVLLSIITALTFNLLVINNNSFLQDLRILQIKYGRKDLIKKQFVNLNYTLLKGMTMFSIFGILYGIILGLKKTGEATFQGNEFLNFIEIIPFIRIFTIQLITQFIILLIGSIISYNKITSEITKIFKI